MIDCDKKAANAIGITRSGKHVILQQTVKSCVPTCVGMLALDHGKIPNYDLIAETSLANDEKQVAWLKELGFTIYPIKLTGKELDNWPKILFDRLAEHGPGILDVYHPAIGEHVVILDEISKDLRRATIRDSFHGRMVTISIDLLQKWMNTSPTDFLSIELMQVGIR